MAWAGAAQAEGFAAGATAEQNVLDFLRGYDRKAGLWETDDRTPTRLEDREMITLRLALERDGAVVPYAEDPDLRRAWALSEVQVAKHHVAACTVPVGLEGAAAEARKGWGRWERESARHLLAVMTKADAVFNFLVRTDEETNHTATYSHVLGLFLEEDEPKKRTSRNRDEPTSNTVRRLACSLRQRGQGSISLPKTSN